MKVNMEIENLNNIVKDNYLGGADAVVAAIIKNSVNDNVVVLGILNPGNVFKDIMGDKYIVTKQAKGMTYVLKKELLPDSMKFGEDNNWTNSNIREFLNSDYLKTLEKRFGAENIIEYETDLFSHDGLSDYGKTIDKVAIRTYDDYRKQREILGDNAFDKNKGEFLATPNSTPSGYGSGHVQIVRSYGRVGCDCFDDYGGVRPFFVLKSSIFVSLDEEK